MGSLRAVLFDVGGVLVDDAGWPALSDPRYRALTRHRLVEAFGVEPPWLEGLYAPDLPSRESDGWRVRTREVFADHWRTFDQTLSDEDFHLVCRALAIPLPHMVPLMSGAAEAVRAARDLGLQVAICSNTEIRSGEDYRRDFVLFGLADRIAAYITSLDVGFAKPHPAIFQRALQQVGVRADEAVMIGDRPGRDIVGAAAVGLRTIWKRRADDAGPCHPQPDAEIATLWELPAILEHWLGTPG